MTIETIINGLWIATSILTAFSLGASVSRIKQAWVDYRQARNFKNPRRKRIKPSPARLWSVTQEDWQKHGLN